MSWWKEPTCASKMHLVDAPVNIEIIGDLRWEPHYNKDNLKLTNVEDSVAELMKFRMVGGQSIVDLTVPGIGRDPTALRAISIATSVNVICSTGWYIEAAHPSFVKNKSVEDLASVMIEELTDGIAATGIKPGVIGEIGCSEPLTENEKKALRAAGQAQARTHVPLTIHPGIFDVERKQLVKKVGKYLDLIQKKDADLAKVYVSHMDWTCFDVNYHKSLINKYGVTLNYDNFGHDYGLYAMWPGLRHFSDRERAVAVVELLRSGHDKNIMLSQDVCMKILYKKYGGYGYAHVLKHIIPMLRYEGASDKQIDKMLIDNPKCMFAL